MTEDEIRESMKRAQKAAGSFHWTQDLGNVLGSFGGALGGVLRERPRDPVGELEAERDLRTLVKLCHPDRNPGWERATEVTAILNRLRDDG